MPKWTSSPGFKVALISIPIFIGALDLTVVSAVLPHVLIDLEIPFQTGMDNAAWIGNWLPLSLQCFHDLHGATLRYSRPAKSLPICPGDLCHRFLPGSCRSYLANSLGPPCLLPGCQRPPGYLFPVPECLDFRQNDPGLWCWYHGAGGYGHGG